MISLKIDRGSDRPLHEQLVDQVGQLVASGDLSPGTRLPPVRQLAARLSMSPGTVLRAYLELGRKHIVTSRKGGGTVITSRRDDPRVITVRRKQLSNQVGAAIIELLSQGYNPDELEAVFFTHLERWREERSGAPVSTEESPPPEESIDRIRIVGSQDPALKLLVRTVA